MRTPKALLYTFFGLYTHVSYTPVARALLVYASCCRSASLSVPAVYFVVAQPHSCSILSLSLSLSRIAAALSLARVPQPRIAAVAALASLAALATLAALAAVAAVAAVASSPSLVARRAADTSWAELISSREGIVNKLVSSSER